MPNAKGGKSGTKSVRTTVSIPAGNYEGLEQIADRKKVSVAWVVRDAIDKYLDTELPLFSGIKTSEWQDKPA